MEPRQPADVKAEMRAVYAAHSQIIAPFGWMAATDLVAVIARYGVRGSTAPIIDAWYTVLLFSAAAGVIILRRRKARPFRFARAAFCRYADLRAGHKPRPWPKGHYRHGAKYAAQCWGAATLWALVAVTWTPNWFLQIALWAGGTILAGSHLHRNRVRHSGPRTLGGRALPDGDGAADDYPDVEAAPDAAYDSAVVTEPLEGTVHPPAAPVPGTGGLKAGTAPQARTPATDAVVAKLGAVLEAFEIDAHVAGLTRGPTVTRYKIEIGPKVKVNAVLALDKNFALSTGCASVRMLAPVPGESVIGVEIPNADRETVTLGDVLNSPAAKRDPHPLLVALGKDVEGRVVLANLAKMPHILIAGATGGGKSTCVHGFIVSILARATPEQVGLILIDPKRVELANYRGVPHLVGEIVTSPVKAARTLASVAAEMDSRYDVMAAAGVRHIDAYNLNVRAGKIRGKEKPYLVVVVDEMADLMATSRITDDAGEPLDVEGTIVRIAQLARAAGIHLVLATQRPSVDVVTGLIKANVPSRLAFATSSLTDSRVILDEPGAEKLIGHGDALFKPADALQPMRLQGAFVSEAEVLEVVRACRKGGHLHVVPSGPEPVPAPAESEPVVTAPAVDPELLAEAAELVIATQFGSVPMLQRKLRVGWDKANSLMDSLEAAEIVGPASEGSNVREVLVRADDKEAALAALRKAM